MTIIKSRFLPLVSLLLVSLVTLLLLSQLDTLRQLLTRAKGEPANLVIDTQGLIGPIPQPWRHLAQGGENTGLNLAPLRSRLAPLRPEYIRLDHLYDFYVQVSRTDAGLTFDWSKLDQVIRDITALGAKPWLSLSYMPPVISQGDLVDLPQNWTDWSAVVQRTIEHVSGRSGLNLAQVYYEVWNEPDLFGQWKTYGRKNYLTLYQSAAAGAAAASNVNPFSLGGPAITAYYDNWAKSLFKFVTTNQLRFDFFSWHRYATDTDIFLDDVARLNAVLDQFPDLKVRIETIITESGHNAATDPGYDTNFGAVHLLNLSRKLTGAVDRLFVFEIEDGQDPQGQSFWGRWGLFTHPDTGSITKPRYDALLLLNQLSPSRLSLTGEGTWVTALAAQNDQSTQVLISNYDPQGQHTELVPVTFTNLTSANFTLSEKFLRGQPREFSVATTAAQLRHQVFMPANSAVMVTLTPAL